MPADSAAAVLGGIRALAAERNWAPVSAFLDALAPLGDRAILIAAAPGLDPAPLAAWLSAVDWRARCRLASLTQLVEDPGPGPAANRVVLALKCGDLLMPSSVAWRCSTVLARPSCSYVVLLVGVEVIDTSADLAVVERAIWQALLGPDGEDWASQDLSAYGCLMWADPADPADPVGGDLADPAGVGLPGPGRARFPGRAGGPGPGAGPGLAAGRGAAAARAAAGPRAARTRPGPPPARRRAAARLAELGGLVMTQPGRLPRTPVRRQPSGLTSLAVTRPG